MTPAERNDFVAGIARWAVTYAWRVNPGLCRKIGTKELESCLWLWFLERADRYDPGKGEPSTWAAFWVRGFLTNHARQFGRRDKHGTQVVQFSDSRLNEFQRKGSDPDPLPDWATGDSLREAVAKLPKLQRRAIAGRLEGLSLRAIGDREKVTAEAIRRRLLLAMRNLRKMFGLSPLLS